MASSPRQVPPLLDALAIIPETRVEVSAAGNTVWVNSDEMSRIDDILLKQQLTGLVHRGVSVPLWLGRKSDLKIDAALQAVFDPEHHFSPTG